MNKKFNFWIFGISILLLGASLFLNISKTVVTNESIVLVFVGILATFIVVGNFAQVSEIRNSTNKQIEELDLKTQNKIDQLNFLFEKVTQATEKINQSEKKINNIAGEANRLYGIITFEKKEFRNSTAHLINAVASYCKVEPPTEIIDIILNIILLNLKLENWNYPETMKDFDYNKYFNLVQELPNTYMQKQIILDLLAKYNDEEKQLTKRL